jgi:hypothetical protein
MVIFRIPTVVPLLSAQEGLPGQSFARQLNIRGNAKSLKDLGGAR